MLLGTLLSVWSEPLTESISSNVRQQKSGSTGNWGKGSEMTTHRDCQTTAAQGWARLTRQRVWNAMTNAWNTNCALRNAAAPIRHPQRACRSVIQPAP